MKLTIKHYYYFNKKANDVGNNLLQSSSWDILRLDSENTPFSIPEDRNEWIKKSDIVIGYFK